MTDEPLFFNGILAGTGARLDAPVSTSELELLLDPANPQRALLRDTVRALVPTMAPARGGDLKNLKQHGWGLIQRVPETDEDRAHNAAVREALKPLLDLRAAQAGPRFKLLEIKRNETQDQWFGRMLHPRGPIDSRILPYYLLIAAPPEEIDFTFQCSLDVAAAVGRICCEPERIELLRAYADRVVAVERGEWSRPRSISFVSTTSDPATQLSASKLVAPLCKIFTGHEAGWATEAVAGTRADLLGRLGGTATPGLAFVASHGADYRGDPAQRELQGGLICQEWTGGKPERQHVLAGEDLVGDASGLVCMLFACYGLGTPKASDFQHLRGEPVDLAPRSFVSRLAQKLIERGALAVIGHVDRAWGWSFEVDEMLEDGTVAKVPQLIQFETAIEGIITGERIGSALENFGQRYAYLGTRLANELEVRADRVPRPRYFAQLWTGTNDARGYALLGDPAARIGGLDA